MITGIIFRDHDDPPGSAKCASITSWRRQNRALLIPTIRRIVRKLPAPMRIYPVQICIWPARNGTGHKRRTPMRERHSTLPGRPCKSESGCVPKMNSEYLTKPQRQLGRIFRAPTRHLIAISVRMAVKKRKWSAVWGARHAFCPCVNIPHEHGYDLPSQIDIYQPGLLNRPADSNLASAMQSDGLVPILCRFDCDEWRHYSIRLCHGL
jgi:hypothetical protein